MEFDYLAEKPKLAAMSKILDPDSPDLKAFKARGGADHDRARLVGRDEVSASMTIDWFEKMRAYMGGTQATAEFAQLYVRADRCITAAAVADPLSVFDAQTALEKWVEEGIVLGKSNRSADEPGREADVYASIVSVSGDFEVPGQGRSQPCVELQAR